MLRSSDKTAQVKLQSMLILTYNLKYNCSTYYNDAMLFLQILSRDNGAFEISQQEIICVSIGSYNFIEFVERFQMWSTNNEVFLPKA